MITNIYKVNSKSMKLLCYIIIALNSAIRFLITFHAFHPQVTNYVSELRAITSETKSWAYLEPIFRWLYFHSIFAFTDFDFIQ